MRKDKHKELLTARLAGEDLVQLLVPSVTGASQNSLGITHGIGLKWTVGDTVVNQLSLDGIVPEFDFLAISLCFRLEPVLGSI